MAEHEDRPATVEDDPEPPMPAPGASEAERDRAAMAWLAWAHRTGRRRV